MNDQALIKEELLKELDFVAESETESVITADLMRKYLSQFLPFTLTENEIVKVIFEATGIARRKHVFRGGHTELVWYVNYKPKTQNPKPKTQNRKLKSQS